MAFNLFRTLLPLAGDDSYPDRLVPAHQKGEVYHSRYVRATMGGVDATKINLFRAHADVNRSFVSGKQGIFKEDTDTFLMDTSEDVRNRVLGPYNICGTIWNKYRGTAAQMTFNAKARSVTNRTKTRREAELAMLMVKQGVGATSPIMMEALRGANPMGDTPQQTHAKFNNTYRDRYLKAHEHLLASVAALNDFGVNNAQEASDLACSGAIAHMARGTSADFKAGERVDDALLIYDTNATLYDMTDSHFVGCAPLMTPGKVYQDWNLPKDVIAYIEKMMQATSFNNGGRMNSAMLNVLQWFWKDIMYCEYGYVNGANGIPELVPVNYLPPRAGRDEKPKYTDKDLVDVPDTEENNKLFGMEKKTKMSVEIVRYCDMLPWEYMCGVGMTPPKELQADIVLDHGVYPLQQYDPRQIHKVKLPIQLSCYALEKGEIVAPITDIIFPQRIFNRILSVTEQQLNNSGSRAPYMDMDMLDDTVTPEEAIRKQRRGEMIPMRGQGRPVQNAFGVLDTTPGQGTINYFQVGKQVTDIMRLISATPEPITGQSQGDGLVRTTQMLIERAGILDEPFYTAYSRAQLQKYEVIGTAGKEWYLQHPDILADLIDDPDMLALLLSRDYEMERFQSKIERSNTPGTERAEANQLLLTFYQQQLIGQHQLAELFNQCSTDDVAQAAREYAEELAEAQSKQAEEAKKGLVAGQIQKRGDELNAMSEQVYEDMMAASMNRANNQNKRELNYDRAKAEHLAPKEPAPAPAASGA